MSARETEWQKRARERREKHEAAMAKLPPLDQGKELWWVGGNDEWYDGGSYETREEAIRAGHDQYDDGFYLVCAKSGPVDVAAHFELDALIESIDENGEYLSGEYSETVFDDCSQDQLDDLQHRIRLAIRTWQIELQGQGTHIKGDLFTSQHSRAFIRGEDVEGQK
jgi:hypothetical protein